MELKHAFDNAVAKGGKFRNERRDLLREYECLRCALFEDDKKQKIQAQVPAPNVPRYDHYQLPKGPSAPNKRPFEGESSRRDGGKRRRKN